MSLMALHEGEGVIWTMDLKIPILGTFTSDIRTLGKKTRMEAVVKGAKTVELSIAKGTYYPVRLSAKLKGVTLNTLSVFEGTDIDGPSLLDL